MPARTGRGRHRFVQTLERGPVPSHHFLIGVRGRVDVVHGAPTGFHVLAVTRLVRDGELRPHELRSILESGNEAPVIHVGAADEKEGEAVPPGCDRGQGEDDQYPVMVATEFNRLR